MALDQIASRAAVGTNCRRFEMQPTVTSATIHIMDPIPTQ